MGSLTSRWQLEYGDVLKCLRPSDLWLSDSLPWSSRICRGFGRWPSPSQREWVRPARSHRVGSAEIKVMGPSEDVWRRLPLPGAVVTWLVTGSWDEGDRVGRANLARFQVDRCLGIASCCVPRIAGRFMAWCRLTGDCCQAGASMGRPAALAAWSRRLS